MGTVSLKSILEIEQIDDLIFRGFTPQGGTGRVYGGQGIAQGLSAASHTVENRPCHSLHAYYLRPGDRSKPIIYDVDIPGEDACSSLLQHSPLSYLRGKAMNENEEEATRTRI